MRRRGIPLRCAASYHCALANVAGISATQDSSQQRRFVGLHSLYIALFFIKIT